MRRDRIVDAEAGNYGGSPRLITEKSHGDNVFRHQALTRGKVCTVNHRSVPWLSGLIRISRIIN